MDCTRRDFLKLAGASLAAAGAARWAAAGDSGDRRKPNIIYLMSDELGYYELSCMGHPNFQTPNIDRLAAGGIRFTQALAGSSVCAPTRCCLMTGKHAGHTSVRTNGGGTPMRAGEATIASVLKSAGYATGGFGKWGCGGRGSTGVPEKHGFDVFFGYYDQVHAHSYYTPYLIRNSQEVPLEGNEGLSKGKTYSHYVIYEEAVKFIRAQKDRPFFCYLPFTPPHGIHDIPDEDPSWAVYKDKPWPEQARRYAAMVNMVDREVGQIVELLKELGLTDDTVFFLCGDNGGMDYFRDAEHPRGFHGPNVDPKTKQAFRGQKGNLYEGGLRVPMIVNWPGRIAAGRVSDLVWYFPDVLPTLAELAGATAPKDIDGMSIVPELLGEKAAGRKQPTHEYLYWEIGQQTAVRMGQWKAICPKAKGEWELYDLATDVQESKSVAAEHADVLAKMKAFAAAAHIPAVEGTYDDNSLEQKDRRAKFGTAAPAAAAGAAAGLDRNRIEKMPQDGLIPSAGWKLVRASSESGANGKPAANALDGDPATWWHTRFQDKVDSHPHELVIDLGEEYEIRGFRYLPRQDGGWNGALKDCEFYVSNSPTDFGQPAVKAAFRKAPKAQDAPCPAIRGRYVCLRTLSSHGDGPWASVAELGVIGK